jgi:hypothetical protein
MITKIIGSVKEDIWVGESKEFSGRYLDYYGV